MIPINKIWLKRYSFTGIKFIPYDIGCVCDEYSEPHHHWDYGVREKPAVILDKREPEEAKKYFLDNYGEIPFWYKGDLR